VWEIGVLPLVFFALAAVAVAGGLEAERTRRRSSGRDTGPRSTTSRAVMVGLSIAALIAISLPLVSASAIQSSQHAVAQGDLNGAISDARRAADYQPEAAAPLIQEALVLEQQGDFAAGAKAAREATGKESTSWQDWVILSRLDARAGDATGSLQAYRKAKALRRGGLSGIGQ
jgi:tetratricopeptide (TPR) repeat protein